MLRPKTLFTVFVAAALILAAPLAGEWGGVAQARNSTATAGSKSRADRPGKRAKGKRQVFSGHAVGTATLREEPLEKPSGELWVSSENFKEELRVKLYDENGEFDEESLAKLDHLFRCRRTHEERSVDPRLYETLSRIQDHFEGKQVQLVSGFRFQRNEGSRHYHASAMDIRIKGVSIKNLRAFADSLDPGGMGVGIYPTSGFVHVDFRAPGQPSYRWTDRSRPGSSGKEKGHKRSRRAVRRSPNT